MKVRSTSLPPTLPSSPSLSSYSSNYLFSCFPPPSILTSKPDYLFWILCLLMFFPSLFSCIPPLFFPLPFPLPLPLPPSPFPSLSFLLPPPFLGWYWHQARDASGGGSSLCLSRGHGSGDDHRAWFWGTKVHAGHDAKGERRACPLNPWPDPHLLLSCILLG